MYSLKVSVLFVIGLQNMNETSESLQETIEEENKIYGDMLQCNFTDTYRMLPEKVRVFC